MTESVVDMTTEYLFGDGRKFSGDWTLIGTVESVDCSHKKTWERGDNVSDTAASFVCQTADSCEIVGSQTTPHSKKPHEAKRLYYKKKVISST